MHCILSHSFSVKLVVYLHLAARRVVALTWNRSFCSVISAVIMAVLGVSAWKERAVNLVEQENKGSGSKNRVDPSSAASQEKLSA